MDGAMVLISHSVMIYHATTTMVATVLLPMMVAMTVLAMMVTQVVLTDQLKTVLVMAIAVQIHGSVMDGAMALIRHSVVIYHATTTMVATVLLPMMVAMTVLLMMVVLVVLKESMKIALVMATVLLDHG